MTSWCALVSVELPDACWCQKFERAQQAESIQIESFVPTGPDERVELVSLTTPEEENVGRLEDLPCVGSCEELYRDDESIELRLHSQGPCPIQQLVEATHLTPRFPIDVNGQNGEVLIVGCRDRIRAAVDSLENGRWAVELDRLERFQPEDDDLTSHQEEVLKVAVDAGYYDYPRDENLTGLAEKLGVAKSTLSQTLSTIESKLIPPRAGKKSSD